MKRERRVKLRTLYIMALLLTAIPVFALALPVPEPEVISQNSGFFQWVLGLALLGNGVFIMRQLKSIDRLWKRTDKFAARLAFMSGRLGYKEEGDEDL